MIYDKIMGESNKSLLCSCVLVWAPGRPGTIRSIIVLQIMMSRGLEISTPPHKDSPNKRMLFLADPSLAALCSHGHISPLV